MRVLYEILKLLFRKNWEGGISKWNQIKFYSENFKMLIIDSVRDILYINYLFWWLYLTFCHVYMEFIIFKSSCFLSFLRVLVKINNLHFKLGPHGISKQLALMIRIRMEIILCLRIQKGMLKITSYVFLPQKNKRSLTLPKRARIQEVNP